jgi:hypothetical protein
VLGQAPKLQGEVSVSRSIFQKKKKEKQGGKKKKKKQKHTTWLLKGRLLGTPLVEA